MAKYSTVFFVTYLYTTICLLPCLGQVDSGTQGTSCADNQYGSKSEDGKLTCKPCDTLPDCPPGLGLSISCGDIVPAKTDIHCVPCVPGKTFSEGHDKLPCKKCKSTLCHENEKILGSCKVDNDNSSCGGVCKKGFYPRDGDLSHCQPCSRCLNNASILVKKCKDDGLPVKKQCEVVSLVPNPSEKQGPSKPNKKRKNHYIYQGYKFYGHPALLTFFVIVIFALGLWLVVTFLRRKFRKKRRSVRQQSQELVSVASGANGTAPSADSCSNTTDSFDVSSNTTTGTGETVSNRLSSGGSGRPKYQQISPYPNDGSNINDEVFAPPVADGGVSGERGDFQQQPSQGPGRKRTISQGSSGRRGSIFTRQNSNPNPEHDKEKPFGKLRSNTFSNFSGLKVGNKEETTSLLSQTDCNDDDSKEEYLSFAASSQGSGEHDDVQPLQKPKRKLSRGSSRRRPSIASRQNSNPIAEHDEEEHESSTQKMGNKEETNSLLSNTDCNDNNLGPLLVVLPEESKAHHQLSGVKIGELNAEKYRQLCDQLNLMGDWEVLAEHMNYTYAEVKIFEKDKNPADQLLTSWGIGKENDVAGLIELIRGMKRLDIVELLESHPGPRAPLL